MRRLFAGVMDARKHNDESVEAGRDYVEAYVQYVHFLENLHNVLTGARSPDEHGKPPTKE